MAKPKVYEYRIQYVDNVYQVVSWTKTQFTKVGEAMEQGKPAILLDTEIVRLTDIRAIVFLPEIVEPTEEEVKKQQEKESKLSEWGFTDLETQRWLRLQGIDISKGVN
jgi:hypothetical protein